MVARRDTYGSLSELRRHHSEGVDFAIEITDRHSTVAVIAPHGGRIEPTTSEIAAAIAGEAFSYYSFVGLIPNAFALLHVTSTHFDEERCLKLIASCQQVIAVHGLARADDTVLVGGRDISLRDAVAERLNLAGFAANTVKAGLFSAVSRANICNRGQSGAGVQLEIPRPVRDDLREYANKLSAFATAVRAAAAGMDNA